MLAMIKSGEAAARRDYRMQLVCERLTGTSQESAFVNDVMQRGIDLEPMAFAAYEGVTGELARPAGFLSHDTLMAGCSPDGFVGQVGILELKCPKTATHIGYVKAGTVPTAYLPQITHNLWITGAAWCDFFSFDDRLPFGSGLQTFCRRIFSADLDLVAYEKAASAFLAEVDADLAALQGLMV